MRYLRTNTATRVTVGPFLDRTDGITPEVALTATNEKLTLMVDTGGVPTLVLDTNATGSGGSNDFVHVSNDDAGFYDLELAAADVNYLGRAILSITYATDHCPVFHEFMIVPANIYDSLVLGSDLIDASAAQVAGDATAATNLAASANQIYIGHVETSAFTSTTTAFESDDITTATADHWIGRVVIFTSGTLAGQATKITDYAKSGSFGHFTVDALTSAPVDEGSFVIV